MAFRIQIRRDSALKWEGNNPVLLQGEFGYETDTDCLKIGDGINPWNDLPYLLCGSSLTVSSATGSITTGTTGIVFTGSGVTVTGNGNVATVNITGGGGTGSGSSGTSGTSGISGTSGTSGIGVTGPTGPAGTSGTSGIGVTGPTGPAGSGGDIGVFDENSLVLSSATGLNFLGANVSVTASGGIAQITVTGATGGAGTSGTSGTSGVSGTSGSSGTSGTSGSSGTSGIGVTGSIGPTGADGSGLSYAARLDFDTSNIAVSPATILTSSPWTSSGFSVTVTSNIDVKFQFSNETTPPKSVIAYFYDANNDKYVVSTVGLGSNGYLISTSLSSTISSSIATNNFFSSFGSFELQMDVSPANYGGSKKIVPPVFVHAYIVFMF